MAEQIQENAGNTYIENGYFPPYCEFILNFIHLTMYKWSSLMLIGLIFFTSVRVWSITLGHRQLQTIDSTSSSQEVKKAYDLLENSWRLIYSYPDSTLLAAKQAHDIFEKTGNLEGVIMSQSNIATAHYFLGEKDKALSIYSSLLWDIDEVQYPAHKAQMLMNVGRTFQDFGMQSIALEYLLESNKRWKDLGNEERIATTLLIIAYSHWLPEMAGLKMLIRILPLFFLC